VSPTLLFNQLNRELCSFTHGQASLARSQSGKKRCFSDSRHLPFLQFDGMTILQFGLVNFTWLTWSCFSKPWF